MLRILHVHSTFSRGGKELRCVRLMNAFGDRAHHVVLSSVKGALDAREAIAPDVRVSFPEDHPPLVGRPSLRRYRALAQFMQRFDLVLTYNWGAMDVVAARRLFAPLMPLPPLVHHEDGFNQDEIDRQKPLRALFRRLVLPTVHALVVPSETLRAVARTYWKAEPALIPNGIDLSRFAPSTGTDIGTLAGLRAVKNLPLLVRAFAESGVGGRLMIAGEGPERERIVATAVASGVADRVDLPGHLDPADACARIGIFALSSDSEQQPISVIEAMACALPVVATDVGDVARMLAPSNRPYIVPPGDVMALADALGRLAADPTLRARIGVDNRSKVLQSFDERPMFSAYRALYEQAVGREHALC